MPTQDPTELGTGTGVADPGSSGPSPSDSSDGSSVVSRADHEAAIAEERKRRAGQEKAHRKEVERLEQQMADLRNMIANSQPQTLQLPDIDPRDPSTFVPHLQHLYKNQKEWQDALIARERAGEFRARLQEAITDATSQGVPLDALDDSSPEAVRASAKEFLAEKRIRDMEEEVNRLKKEKDQAVTTARAEAGALGVSTATGGRTPTNPTLEGIQARKQELEAAKDKAVRRGGPASMVEVKQINRELQALDAQQQTLLAGSRR